MDEGKFALLNRNVFKNAGMSQILICYQLDFESS